MDVENMPNNSNADQVHQYYKHLPKRIILVRHGESTANTDEKVYGDTADHKIPLSKNGIEQARQAGEKILDVVSQKGNNNSENWKAYFYVSPYERTRSTLREIGRSFPRNRVNGVREECRIREQDFGNFQDYEKMKELKKIRNLYGRFFYRFPEGESGADVYDRVSGFLESLWRDIYMKRLSQNAADELNVVIVSHGLSVRIFLTKWFKWTVEQFESLKSPKNCEFRVMELGASGEYSLAIQHNEETLKGWGLSPDMIKDQNLRAQANYGGTWNEKSPSYLNTFFELADSDQQSAEENGGNK
ncbi:hypothetical protein ACH5RR_001365 [Cinchona calisaya]|uniref:Phosphoglycerate mutase n=1 Tax=Cinchona calisaya TaxID=153742 RepID=A0ABD3B3H7_9GENT